MNDLIILLFSMLECFSHLVTAAVFLFIAPEGGHVSGRNMLKDTL